MLNKVKKKIVDRIELLKTNVSVKKRNKVRYSLRWKITALMITLITSMIVICWGINKMFLADFYEKSKISTLREEYEFLNKELSEEVIIKIEECYSSGDSEYLVEISNMIEGRSEIASVEVYIMDIYTLGEFVNVRPYYPYDATNRVVTTLKQKIMTYYTNELEQNNNDRILVDGYDFIKLKDEEEFSIYKTYEGRTDSNSIELFGMLDSGVYVVLSSNFESIQESVSIANTFLAYVGLVLTVIGGILVFFVSSSISKPILELSNIAKKMANLDFDVKSDIISDDEIGDLSKSINFLSEKLETTISELKVANAELKSDIERKDKIDSMRKEFLSSVSHELKTPIALIQGYAEGLKDNINDDEESRDFYCEVIVDEAKKMNNMVMKLLDLNHIEFGDSQISIDRFDIYELINAVISSREILFQQNEATLIFDKEHSLDVWADAFMIEEVLNNYISNAFNHLDFDKIIEIKLEKKEDVVRISVFNTGKNIPEDEIDKIWDRFYKVDKARTREYGGSGVGLSIVKAIMDSHGRQFGVLNKENGVEFWFELDIKV